MNIGKGKIGRLVRLVAHCLSIGFGIAIDWTPTGLTQLATRPRKLNAAIFDR
jgi:hypothetical protein